MSSLASWGWRAKRSSPSCKTWVSSSSPPHQPSKRRWSVVCGTPPRELRRNLRPPRSLKPVPSRHRGQVPRQPGEPRPQGRPPLRRNRHLGQLHLRPHRPQVGQQPRRPSPPPGRPRGPRQVRPLHRLPRHDPAPRHRPPGGPRRSRVHVLGTTRSAVRHHARLRGQVTTRSAPERQPRARVLVEYRVRRAPIPT